MDQANRDARFYPDDIFEREQYAVHAMQLINSYPAEKGACTIAVDAPWGMGKSTFIHMWRNELREQNPNPNPSEEGATKPTGKHASPFAIRNVPFYYNAWENDHSEDAFLPLVFTICGAAQMDDAPPATGKIQERLEKLIVAACGAASTLACYGMTQNLDFAVQVGSATSVGVGTLWDVIKKKDSEVVKNAYQQRKESIEAFRAALAEFAAEYGKLFVFIDELDRCKPTFAVKTLEAIKFFFDVPNVVFVFAIDAEQLTHSIKGTYSITMDAGSYLSKFIEFHIDLPAPTTRQILAYTVKDANPAASIVSIMTEAMSLCGITPREAVPVVQKTFKLYRTHIGSSLQPEGFALFMLLLGLKTKHADVYAAVMDGRSSWDSLHWHENSKKLAELIDGIVPYMNKPMGDIVEEWDNARNHDKLAEVLATLAFHMEEKKPVRVFFSTALNI
ncbi:MAG: hypothetical protein IJ350_08155 [Clostridia bacterium]|nr:hypothetical protein [Clostridia bacterium]